MLLTNIDATLPSFIYLQVPLVQVKDEYIFNHLSKENTSLFLRRLCYGEYCFTEFTDYLEVEISL